MRAFPKAIVLAAVFFVLGAAAPALASQDSADQMCLQEGGTWVYRSDKPWKSSFTENNKTYYNLYGTYCEDKTNGIVAATGHCVASRKCLATECAGEACKTSDVKVDTSQNRPSEPSLSDTGDVSGGTPQTPTTQPDSPASQQPQLSVPDRSIFDNALKGSDQSGSFDQQPQTPSSAQWSKWLEEAGMQNSGVPQTVGQQLEQWGVSAPQSADPTFNQIQGLSPSSQQGFDASGNPTSAIAPSGESTGFGESVAQQPSSWLETAEQWIKNQAGDAWRAITKEFGSDAQAASGSQDTQSGESSQYLATQRAALMNEIKNDPELKQWVMAILAKESNTKEGTLATLEAGINLSVARGYGSYWDLVEAGFYGPYNRGEVDAVIARGLTAGEVSRGENAINAVAAGSNVTDMATDQGLINEIRGEKWQVSGDQNWFGQMEGTSKWAGEQRALIAAYDASTVASPRDVWNNNSVSGNSSSATNPVATAYESASQYYGVYSQTWSAAQNYYADITGNYYGTSLASGESTLGTTPASTVLETGNGYFSYSQAQASMQAYVSSISGNYGISSDGSFGSSAATTYETAQAAVPSGQLTSDLSSFEDRWSDAGGQYALGQSNLSSYDTAQWYVQQASGYSAVPVLESPSSASGSVTDPASMPSSGSISAESWQQIAFDQPTAGAPGLDIQAEPRYASPAAPAPGIDLPAEPGYASPLAAAPGLDIQAEPGYAYSPPGLDIPAESPANQREYAWYDPRGWFGGEPTPFPNTAGNVTLNTGEAPYNPPGLDIPAEPQTPVGSVAQEQTAPPPLDDTGGLGQQQPGGEGNVVAPSQQGQTWGEWASEKYDGLKQTLSDEWGRWTRAADIISNGSLGLSESSSPDTGSTAFPNTAGNVPVGGDSQYAPDSRSDLDIPAEPSAEQPGLITRSWEGVKDTVAEAWGTTRDTVAGWFSGTNLTGAEPGTMAGLEPPQGTSDVAADAPSTQTPAQDAGAQADASTQTTQPTQSPLTYDPRDSYYNDVPANQQSASSVGGEQETAAKRDDLTISSKSCDGGLCGRGNADAPGDNTIKNLQRFLNENGYVAGNVDGIYGRQTEAAVRAFQKDQKIATDGIVGAETLGKMNKIIAAENATAREAQSGNTSVVSTPQSQSTPTEGEVPLPKPRPAEADQRQTEAQPQQSTQTATEQSQPKPPTIKPEDTALQILGQMSRPMSEERFNQLKAAAVEQAKTIAESRLYDLYAQAAPAYIAGLSKEQITPALIASVRSYLLKSRK